ncbi:hypothetical protein BGX38DRAFT_248137 [Terfezia claveryi]|nr:hypothetical protein BGX38DRAFT_248137 [Terfezia claveryi]
MADEISELHQHAPITGEQYAFPNDTYRRLQDYAMHTGFAIVVGSGSEKKGRIEYLCVHHGKPRNTRQLEERTRDTKSRAKDCKWLCFLSFKKINDGAGGGKKGWVLTVKDLTHTHQLEVENAAIIYPEHKRQDNNYQKQLAKAVNFRSAGASYNEYLRFQTQPGHLLDPKTFYNIRRIDALQTPADLIEQMLTALTKAGFHTRTRWSEEVKQTVIVCRLEQILFISPE